MDVTKAREQFEEALKEAAKRIRFRNYEWDKSKAIVVKPEEIEICNNENCDAGDDCVHKFKFKGVTFCAQ